MDNSEIFSIIFITLFFVIFLILAIIYRKNEDVLFAKLQENYPNHQIIVNRKTIQIIPIGENINEYPHWDRNQIIQNNYTIPFNTNSHNQNIPEAVITYDRDSEIELSNFPNHVNEDNYSNNQNNPILI